MSAGAMLESAEPRSRDDESLFEIVDGQRVEIAPMSALACLIANALCQEINFHCRPLNVGQAVVEVLFHLALPIDRSRRPDVAFVSYTRWPRERPIDPDINAWGVVPNLAVEVVSPNYPAGELMEKIDEYFRAGVQVVWVVYPSRSMVYVYESPTRLRGLTRSDTLEGGDVLPGFRLPLQALFPEK